MSRPDNARILIAEDEALISIMLSDDLRDEGYRIAGPFGRVADALAWLEGETPDVAIVDYMLRDGPCTGLTDLLSQRGVPFIIFSAYPHDLDTPPELRSARWLDKPLSADALLAALETLTPPTH
jgi:DNA-binding response OmpR family regulator